MTHHPSPAPLTAPSPSPDEATRLPALLLRLLATLTEQLAAHAGQAASLRQILRILESGGYRWVTVTLLSPSGDRLVVADSTATGDHQEISYQCGEGITGRVLQTGAEAVVPSICNEPEFRDRFQRRRVPDWIDAAFICVPVKLATHIVGTLSADVPVCDGDTLRLRTEVLRVVAAMIAYDVAGRQREAMDRAAAASENLRLRAALGEQFRPENMIGTSDLMRSVYRQIQQVASSQVTVLLRGESGTGKELVATAIHYASERRDRPFVRINCAALNEHLLESELFGHEKGAFTGAVQLRRGRIEEAEGGTLFLDEIGDFSPATQVKLLRVLQEREYQRVGSSQTRQADIRIIAATNRDLEAAVDDGSFRLDLYYRVNVFPIVLPPLRERRDDILTLANHILACCSERMEKPITRISTTAITMLTAYHWPGNVRELENCIEYAVLVARGSVIDGRDLPATLQMPDAAQPDGTISLKDMVDALQRDAIVEALKRHDGVVTRAARDLGITARMVHYKIDILRIPYAALFPQRRHVKREQAEGG